MNDNKLKEFYTQVRNDSTKLLINSDEVPPSLKNAIYGFIVKQQDYMNRLAEFQRRFQKLNQKYDVSHYNSEQWKRIITLTQRGGTFFFPDAKARILLKSSKVNSNVSGLVAATPCADGYDALEVEIGTNVLEMSVACTLGGITPAAAICWAAVTAYYLYMNDYLENDYWCECMINNYGSCLY